MRGPMQLEQAKREQAGKLVAEQKLAEICVPRVNHRLSIMDVNTGIQFLIDSGANVSVYPLNLVSDKSASKKCEPNKYKLFAANGTQIETYGLITKELNFRLRRNYRWVFIVADVKQPIIGADFLVNYKLLIDLSGRRLIDSETQMKVVGCISDSNQPTIKTIVDDHPYIDLLEKYPSLTKPFSFKEVPKHNVCHHIETSGAPVYSRARPLPPDRYVRAKKEFQLMMDLGICRPSKSAWASPLHIVPKKDGNIRPCGDYRMLNAITKPDRYPVPRLQDFTYILAGKKVFSSLDINRAYNCIPVNNDDIEKTAVITPFGLYEFPRMPFGLRNAAQTFQRFMDHSVLQGLDFLYSFADDVIIASADTATHKRHLEEVFKRFNAFGITINISKCCFGQEKLNFLGYEVSTEGIRPLQDKVKAICDYPRPKTVEELRRYLGMLNFYRSHIPHAAQDQAEMNKYLHNSKKKDKTIIEWTKEAECEFEKSKVSLQKAALLTHPLPDSPLALMTDASDSSVGAVLQQREGNNWSPLSFFSKRLTEAQRKYSTYDRELLGIYLAIIHFRKLIEGREVVIYTDHKPLVYLFSKLGSEKETPRRTRQIMFISEFTTKIEHISGADNVTADSLSRIETINCPTGFDLVELARAQETDKQLSELIQGSKNNSLRFSQHKITGTEYNITYETSTGKKRMYLPAQFRDKVIEAIHNISHPGIRTTRRMTADRYFWVGMNKDVNRIARACIRCQRAKVHRHTLSELGHFPDCDRFEHIHIDIVGPLPTSQEGHRYLITMLDRATSWPEAIPVSDISANSVARVVYENWIVRFGCPLRLTSDQGRQFESEIFKHLMRFLGVEKIRTTAYHPQGNGAVERMHRSLKVALRAKLDNENWLGELPTVLLGLRAAPRCDTNVSAAQLVYGSTVRLPGEFYDNTNSQFYDSYEYVQHLRETISSLKPKPSQHRDSRTIFVHPELKKCSHVFVRRDMAKKSLQPPYDGPYQVIKRDDKIFTVQLPSGVSNISIDRIKPAYLLNSSDDQNYEPPPKNTKPQNISNGWLEPEKANGQPSNIKKGILINKNANENAITRTTHSGRVVKRPVRFNI